MRSPNDRPGFEVRAARPGRTPHEYRQDPGLARDHKEQTPPGYAPPSVDAQKTDTRDTAERFPIPVHTHNPFPTVAAYTECQTYKVSFGL
jgi:hypothetical protein